MQCGVNSGISLWGPWIEAHLVDDCPLAESTSSCSNRNCAPPPLYSIIWKLYIKVVVCVLSTLSFPFHRD